MIPPASHPCPIHRRREAWITRWAAVLLSIALLYTLGYPISLSWDLRGYFAFGQLHSLVFAGNAVLLVWILRWLAQRPTIPQQYRLAGVMLLLAHIGTVLTAVLWIPAYTPDHGVVHGGMALYVLILLLGNFSLMVTVPWWTWPRVQLLRLVADTLLAMSVVDLGLTVLLPALVPGWVWTPALTAAVFRLETTIGLVVWYAIVYWRFGGFQHPAVRYWAVGAGCMLATDAALLWGTLQLERGATDWLLGAGMPFWMVHQTLWSLGLFHVLGEPPAWSRVPLRRHPRGQRVRWAILLRQGATLSILALTVSMAGSLRATVWLVAAVILGQVVAAYELMAERDELDALNERYARAQQQLVALNSALVTSNTRLREMSVHQAYLLAQRQLRAAEVAHDAGNMLQDVKVSHALIHQHYRQQGLGLPSAVASPLEVAETSLQVIGDLLDAIVAAAQLDAGALKLKLATVDGSALLQQVVTQQHARATASRVRVRLHLPAQAVPIQCDSRLLSRAVHNVVSNALKYTGELRRDGSGHVDIGLGAIDDGVSIWVHDNGPGIAPEHLARLGQPFVRGEGELRSAAGFGLGLAFSRGVVELHPGGELTLESVPGSGTTVTIRLPGALAPPSR